MAPAPSSDKEYPPADWQEARHHGERRNFALDYVERRHKFPIGSLIFIKTPAMSVAIGPMYIKEQCAHALYPRGPPTYILQPAMNGDNSKWMHASEKLMVYEDSVRVRRVQL